MEYRRICMFYFFFLSLFCLLLSQNQWVPLENYDKKSSNSLTTLPSTSLTYLYEWNITWGGTLNEHGSGIVVGESGNIFITGDTTRYGTKDYDVIFLMYDSEGNLIRSKTWGGCKDDKANGIAVDGSENTYITGFTLSYGVGNADVFLLKYDSEGNFLWNKTWGGVDNDKAYGIVLDNSTNVFITGFTDSYGAGDNDIFLLKYNSEGNLLWNKTTGGFSYDNGYGIVLDGLGNILIVGSTNSYGSGNQDVFLLKYDSVGNPIWNKTWGTTVNDYGTGITVDKAGNIFIIGTKDKCAHCVDDVLLLKFNSTGNLLWNITWGGESDDRGFGIVEDGLGNVIVTGATHSYGGGWPDVFILKYDSEGNHLLNKTWGDNNDGGTGIALDEFGNIFIIGSIGWHEWGDNDLLFLKYVLDTDEDGLSDDDELNIYATNPLDTDSDDDLLLDGTEITGEYGYVTNATNSDTDGDTLLDGEEILFYFTNPIDPDTDNDGYNDGYEVRHNFDPNDRLSSPFIDNIKIIIIILIPVIIILSGLMIYFEIKKYKKKKKKYLNDLDKYIKDILQFEIDNKRSIFPFELVSLFNLDHSLAIDYHKLLNSPIKYSKEETLLIKEKAKEVIQELEKPTLYDIINNLKYDFITAKKVSKFLVDMNMADKVSRVPEIKIDLIHEKEPIKADLRKIKIFISYSTLDSEYFQIPKIAKKLEKYPEIDKILYWEADSGENIVEYMERTLKECKVFVLFCSENSLNSRAVTDEWQAAFQLRKKDLLKILPVYEDEIYIPALLTPLLNVKFDKDNLDKFIENLYSEILRS